MPGLLNNVKIMSQRPEGQLLWLNSNVYGSHTYVYVCNIKLFPRAAKGKANSRRYRGSVLWEQVVWQLLGAAFLAALGTPASVGPAVACLLLSPQHSRCHLSPSCFYSYGPLLLGCHPSNSYIFQDLVRARASLRDLQYPLTQTPG